MKKSLLWLIKIILKEQEGEEEQEELFYLDIHIIYREYKSNFDLFSKLLQTQGDDNLLIRRLSVDVLTNNPVSSYFFAKKLNTENKILTDLDSLICLLIL